jgi:Rrf2 family cysteine metabolism transcriptional repressor
MKLSTKGRYGLRAMIELALRYGEGPIALRNVAANQDISEHYLEQLMGTLRKASLVTSIRGAQGGYMLSKEPGKIKVGDIIRALEGPIAPVDCVIEKREGEVCHRINKCIARDTWLRLRDAISEVLDGVTLEDLIEETKDVESNRDVSFFHGLAPEV